MTDLPIHPELESTWHSYSMAVDAMIDALNGQHPAPAAQEIAQQCVQVAALLLKKNAAYGDSALNPLAVFARDLTPSERMGVRMDDKLSRLARGAADGEDIETDLIGYLVLQRIARAREVAPEFISVEVVPPANADEVVPPD